MQEICPCGIGPFKPEIYDSQKPRSAFSKAKKLLGLESKVCGTEGFNII